jgi:hypothetical protein
MVALPPFMVSLAKATLPARDKALARDMKWVSVDIAERDIEQDTASSAESAVDTEPAREMLLLTGERTDIWLAEDARDSVTLAEIESSDDIKTAGVSVTVADAPVMSAGTMRILSLTVLTPRSVELTATW